MNCRRALVPILVVVASSAAAQTLSPGKLGRGHEDLEGLSHCTDCHEFGKRVDGGLCLQCHAPLKRLVETGKGFHGKQAKEKADCFSCHKDHRGVGTSLTDWGGRENAFDHRRTGYVLDGKHQEASCEKCHDSRLVKDRELRDLFGKDKDGTYLGLEQRCGACHFDEHRGQLKGECSKCHDTRGFKPAAGFKHNDVYKLVDAHANAECTACHARAADPVQRPPFPPPVDPRAYVRYAVPLLQERGCRACHFDEHRGQFKGDCARCHDQKAFKPVPGFRHDERFVLVGAHARAACTGCHARVPAPRAPAGPKPVDAANFARYRPTPKGCVDCHKDPHENRFGAECLKCHNQESWLVIRSGDSTRAFHDRSRFPLKGAHRHADCAACHPPAPKSGLQLKGFPFERCGDCHVDAHLGQLTPAADGLVRCERCHDEQGFLPPRYPVEEHRTYPLQGAHVATACNDCHVQDRAGLEDRVRARPGRPRGTETIDFTRLVFPGRDTKRCDSCHADVHRGQFAQDPARACASCHAVTSFQDLHFNHDVDTRYPLQGRHAQAQCGACHPRTGDGGTQVWRGVPTVCAACHEDPHRGQFTGTDCARCHTTERFQRTLFRHDDPAFTSFVPQGAHARVACASCHPVRRTPEGFRSAWYRGVPRDCVGCHQDPHAAPGALSPTTATCTRCHNDAGWERVSFNHEATHLPLRQRHADVDCRACHAQLAPLALEPSCGACHADVHGGRLGNACERCHDQASFRSGDAVAAHAQTRFPLLGRHGMAPCESCHQARADRTLGGLSVRCEDCHDADVQRTAGGPRDHAGLNPLDCRGCHTPSTWRRARFFVHDRCFPLSSGEHARYTCEQCHSALRGLAVDQCASFTADCIRCHGCEDRKHRGIPGYTCGNRRCYECHPSGEEE